MGGEQSRNSDSDSQVTGTMANFYVNGVPYSVNMSIGPNYRLVDFIRNKVGLTGTKVMCREGGCGACIVSIQKYDSDGNKTLCSVNSCLVPVLCCDGWDIKTIESMGNKKEGYSQIQKAVVKYGGTQCGFCTPGMIMNMSCLQKQKSAFGVIKLKDIEDSMDSNICRCTGYRPILDAFKSLSLSEETSPGSSSTNTSVDEDIEDIPSCPEVTKKRKVSESSSDEWVHLSSGRSLGPSSAASPKWVKPSDFEDIVNYLKIAYESQLTYSLIAGNTGTGVFKHVKSTQLYIDVSFCSQLAKMTKSGAQITIGGGASLAKIMGFLRAPGIGFEYCIPISKHIQRIANYSVRNTGSVAGNLMLKKLHPEFPSDLFVLLESVNAQLLIVTQFNQTVTISLRDFLLPRFSMDYSIIKGIILRKLAFSDGYIFRSYKISKRFQSSHAYVNAAFLFKIDKEKQFEILERPNIVYGGLHSDFVHATKTEDYFVGKSLLDSTVLDNALQIFTGEIQVDSGTLDGSPSYRKLVAQSLLYKCILSILGPEASSRLRSGGKKIKRGLISGTQSYDLPGENPPLYQPINKLEGSAQCSGEAEYINDICPVKNELFGSFVVTTVARAEIDVVDFATAINMPGVVAFLQATDIPGENSYMVFDGGVEEIFATNAVSFCGQPVGLIVAERREQAVAASKAVNITYKNVKKPILTIRDAIKSIENENPIEVVAPMAQETDSDQQSSGLTVVQGEFSMGSQYHFPMETHITICIPKENGLQVYCATQHMDQVQAAIAKTLKIPNNEIDIEVRRLGGAYGSKISRAAHVATACAVAAHKLNRPVRLSLDLETNMETMGKRPPYSIKYNATVSETGKIQSLSAKVYCDTGYVVNEETASAGVYFFNSLYDSSEWKITAINCVTNTSSNTWCRAPGSTPGIAMIESIMEHIAFNLKMDPIAVRFANQKPNEDSQPKIYNQSIANMIEEVRTSGDYAKRKEQIHTFNKNNRWRKRGMAMVPMRYPLDYGSGPRFPAYVAIYKSDGTVAVSHAGIECGQGLNTKVAQAVAAELGIPLTSIVVKPSNNVVSANGDCTGGSMTSEVCCQAAVMACRELKGRMEPIKKKMKEPTWLKLVKQCHKAGIDLTASHNPAQDGLGSYDIWVVTLSEVEIDCLTGEHKSIRVDILEDAGLSLNPAVDIGQIEGAFLMGLGYWTMEKIVYDETSGQLLTNGTWQYKPPMCKDVPEDFRVTLLKNSRNPLGVLRSKATGEPPLCSSVSVLFALKNAIYEARQDVGNNDWFQLDGPVTAEDILIKCLTATSQFNL